MGQTRDELRGEMGQTRDELRGQMGEMRGELRQEFRDGLAENRRHSAMLFESVRDDIRIVAEGVAALTAKVDALSR
jgi:hypothetical protein